MSGAVEGVEGVARMGRRLSLGISRRFAYGPYYQQALQKAAEEHRGTSDKANRTPKELTKDTSDGAGG
jgi:hypothetical protein